MLEKNERLRNPNERRKKRLFGRLKEYNRRFTALKKIWKTMERRKTLIEWKIKKTKIDGKKKKQGEGMTVKREKGERLIGREIKHERKAEKNFKKREKGRKIWVKRKMDESKRKGKNKWMTLLMKINN